MVELLIFQFHIIGAFYAFTKSWMRGTIKDGLLALGIIGLIFTIGWALSSPIANLIMPSAWNTIYFTIDSLSLVLLFIPETVFFYFYFLKERKTELEN